MTGLQPQTCPSLGGFISLKFCTQSDQCSRGGKTKQNKNQPNKTSLIFSSHFLKGKISHFALVLIPPHYDNINEITKLNEPESVLSINLDISLTDIIKQKMSY